MASRTTTPMAVSAKTSSGWKRSAVRNRPVALEEDHRSIANVDGHEPDLRAMQLLHVHLGAVDARDPPGEALRHGLDAHVDVVLAWTFDT